MKAKETQAFWERCQEGSDLPRIRKPGWSHLSLTSEETLDKYLTDEASVSSSVGKGCRKLLLRFLPDQENLFNQK